MPHLPPPAGLQARRLRLDLGDVLVFRYPVATPRELGNPLLTAAEQAIVELALGGASNRQIATLRGTSTRTVANQLSTVFRKLRITSRPELFLHCAGKVQRNGEDETWRKTG
jgi:DNA-binding CsgD family transcriptional regulator